eukprot:1147400-Pelagomonas_calceolata.AAC.4
MESLPATQLVSTDPIMGCSAVTYAVQYVYSGPYGLHYDEAILAVTTTNKHISWGRGHATHQAA